jgi:hypothetical protein
MGLNVKDTLFIQFFNKTKSGYYDLCNGFSDTWEICKARGDFLWVEHESDNDKWYDEDIYLDRALPISKGKVYISASYINHLFQAYTWATQYADIDFVVGGPVAAERFTGKKGWNSVHFKVEKELPSNLKITGQSIENLFNVPDFSGSWKLEVPDTVPENSRIYFSYTLENQCYWKKCIFCTIAQHSKQHFRRRTNFDFEFKNLDFKGRKIVRLNTGSITPGHIKAILPNLPNGDDIEYRFFMRAAKAETNALKQVIEKIGRGHLDCTLGFGIEFPSDHMWEYLDKGTSMTEVIETLEFCTWAGFKVNANVILGWNNLIKDDLKDLEKFMDRFSERTVTTLQLRWLFAHPYTKIYETYDGVQNTIRLGPFNCGFNVSVNDRQKELNLAAAKIIKEKCLLKKIKLEGYKNLKKGE